jgi:hypothetical protein
MRYHSPKLTRLPLFLAATLGRRRGTGSKATAGQLRHRSRWRREAGMRRKAKPRVLAGSTWCCSDPDGSQRVL